jgi:hypothetical protein
MAPKSGFRRKKIAGKVKAPLKSAFPGKICHRCGREVPVNQNLLQHDRICRAHTQNRQVLVDHVRQEMLRRNGSLDLNVSEDLHMIPAMNHFIPEL